MHLHGSLAFCASTIRSQTFLCFSPVTMIALFCCMLNEVGAYLTALPTSAVSCSLDKVDLSVRP